MPLRTTHLALAILPFALTVPALPSVASTATYVDADDFSSNAAYAQFYGQKLTWSKASCPSFWLENLFGLNTDVECAAMSAPKNWYDAKAGTITVTLARKTGASPEGKRLLLSNPGGPGLPGLISGATVVPGTLLATQDSHYAVGMDTRGVRASTPLTCKVDPNAKPEPAYMSDGEPRHYSTELVHAQARNTLKALDYCFGQPEFASYAPFVNSDQTSRDFNLARAVLGFAQSDYYGLSYGTWLGSIIAKQFPHKFDRILLDGNVNWQKPTFDEIGPLQVSGAQAALDRTVLPFIARHDETYHLGSTIAEVQRRFEEARSKLVNAGVAAQHFHSRIISANLSLQAPHTVGAFVRDLLQASTPAEIRAVAHVYPAWPQTDVDMGHYAVACGDVQGTQDVDGWWKSMEANMANLPLNAYNYAIPYCYGWAKGSALSAELLAKPVKQVLMIQQEADATTGYTKALEARLGVPGNAKMVLIDDLGGHGSGFLVSPCANSVVQGYLKRGDFPTTDVACQAPPLRFGYVDAATKEAKVVTDSQIYEFLRPSTPETPLPRGNFYVMRDLSDPAVDPTPPGRIGGPTRYAAEESTLSPQQSVALEYLAQLHASSMRGGVR